jgi:hypothetical protein
MKKSLLGFCLLVICALGASSQTFPLADIQMNYEKKLTKPTKVDLSAKLNFSDTVEYVWMKQSSNAGYYFSTNGSTLQAASQYFTCPQTISVKGFNFYALSVRQASLNVTCELYLADAAHMPTGSALATTTVAVDNLTSNGYHCRAMFPSPVNVNAPYCVVVSNNNLDSLAVFTSGNGQGLGENLSGARFGSTWYSLLNILTNDLDFLFEPIVSYNIADVYFTHNAPCLVNGQNVSFDMTATPIYSSDMYNYMSYVDSVKYQFSWNFGDATPLISAMDTNHTYVTAGTYTVSLFDTYVGWYFYATRDTTAVLSACVGIDENSSKEFSIYPNPVSRTLTIADAENSTIQIISMLGTTVRRIENASRLESIDMSSLSEGTYFVRIENNDKVVTRKISVLR